MPYVSFSKLTDEEKAEAIAARPRWDAAEFQRFAFWIRPNGRVSRRAGHHQLTAEEGAKIDAMLRGDDVTIKGSLAGYKTADFTLAPE